MVMVMVMVRVRVRVVRIRVRVRARVRVRFRVRLGSGFDRPLELLRGVAHLPVELARLPSGDIVEIQWRYR